MPSPMRIAALLAPSLVLALGACNPAERVDAAGAPPAVAENVAAFHARLKAAAAGLDAMGRVDDLARWAPALCRAPLPPSLFVSESADVSTHGGKLYSVHAKDRAAYAALSDLGGHPSRRTDVPGLEDCTQVLVKEAFAPVEILSGTSSPAGDDSPAPRLRPAAKDGKRFRAGASRGLYVMLRLDPKTPGTDDGWVYGTIAPDGAITSSGRVASCMSCHTSAPHGRLFGLPKSAGE